MKHKPFQKLVFLIVFLSFLVFSTNLIPTQISATPIVLTKAPLGTTSYSEDFTTTTYEDAGQTTADGWGDDALTTDRDLTVSYLGSYSTSYIVSDIAVQGRKAYLAVLTWSINSQTARTVNVTDPTAMTLMGWRNIAPDVQSVAIHGDMLYVGRQGWVIQYNVSNPYGAYINQGAVAVTGNVTDLAVQGHFLHAVTRTTSGSDYHYTIDIQNPTSMNIVYTALATDFYGLDIQGELLYLAIGTSGLYVRNISNPYSQVTVDNYNTPGTVWDVLVDGGIAYLADGSAGVTILNVTDPTDITYLGNIDTAGDARELALQGNTLFVADWPGTIMIDVTNPQHPTYIGQVTAVGAYALAVDGEILYLGRGNAMETYAITMHSVMGPGLPWFNRYNAYDAWDVAIQGNLAYVAGGSDGFYTLDISNPRNPVLLDRIQHTGIVNYYSVEVQGGYAFIEDLANGAWVSFSVLNPSNIQYLSWVSYSQGYDFVISGDVLYIADGTLGLYLMNISNPAILGPNLGSPYSDGFNYTSVWVQGHTVYATATGPTSGTRGIFVYDATDLSNLVLIDHYSLTFPRDVVVHGDFMAVADGLFGVYTYNVTDPFNILFTSYFDPNDYNTHGVDMSGTNIIMTQKANGVYLVNATDIHNLQMIASYTSAGMAAHRVTVHDEFAFVANGDSIEIFQLFNTAANSFDTSPSIAQSLTIDSTTDIIVNATLTANTWGYPATSIQWELTANGIDWEPIPVGVLHDFTDIGSDLRYRATLDATYADQSPYIYNITITYGYTTPPTAPILTDPGTTIAPAIFWVNWTASTDPDGTVDFYQLEMSDSNAFTTILNQWVPTTPYQQIDVLPVGTYYFRVRAIDNDAVPGPWSNIEDLIVQPVIGPPPIPGFPIEAIIVGAIVALSLGMIYRRKRK
ncbi:MAG: hypothetical protein ACFE89_02625 [Candidatus Hodarchaeota archaeon]